MEELLDIVQSGGTVNVLVLMLRFEKWRTQYRPSNHVLTMVIVTPLILLLLQGMCAWKWMKDNCHTDYQTGESS